MMATGARILILTDAGSFADYGEAQAIRAFGRICGEASPFASNTGETEEKALPLRITTIEKRAVLLDPEMGSWESDDLEHASISPAPIAAALLTSESFEHLEQLPQHLATAVSAAPVIIFAARQGKFRDRTVLDDLARRNVDEVRQAAAWIDISVPEEMRLVHHTWPHELPLHERPVTVAKLSALDGGEDSDADLLPTDAHGLLELEIDVDWAGDGANVRGFAAPPRRGRGRSEVRNTADTKLARAREELLSYVNRNDAQIVVIDSKAERDRLHPKLAFLAEESNVFWRDKTPGPPLVELITKLDAENLAAAERWLGVVADGKPGRSESVASLEIDARNGLERLVNGQVASLAQVRPTDERDFERIVKKADDDFKEFATALKIQTLEDLKYRDASKAMLSHLGRAGDCLTQNERKPHNDISRQLRRNIMNPTSTFKLELREDKGWLIIQQRIYEIAVGITAAQGALLSLHWARFAKPYLTERVEQLAEKPEDYPAIPNFDPETNSFTSGLEIRINDTLERPPPVEVPSLYSLKPVVTTVRQIIRKSPMYLTAAAAALAYFGVNDGVAGDAEDRIPWEYVGPCLFLILVFYALGLRMKNKEEQATKRDAYMKAVEGAVRTKLGDVVTAWFDHVDTQRTTFIAKLQEDIRIQAHTAAANTSRQPANVRIGLEQRLSELEERIKEKTDEFEEQQRGWKAASAGLFRIAGRMIKDFEKDS
ncbi:MAG: hypothetical protein AAF950_16915 [Pseudomonadota bacterium]